MKSLRQRRSKEVEKAITDEFNQMHYKKVWIYLTPEESYNIKNVIPVIMLEKEKFYSKGLFLKVKAR